MKNVIAFAAALSLLSCSKSEPAGNPDKSSEQGNPLAAKDGDKAESGDAKPPKDTKVSAPPKPAGGSARGPAGEIAAAFAKAGLTLGPAPIDDWKLSDGDLQFLGWSSTGAYYAVRDTHAEEEFEGNPDPPGYRFLQVRDTHSQRVVAVFRDKKWGDQRPESKAVKAAAAAWKSLKADRNAYEAYARELALAKPVPSRVGPDGTEVVASVVGNAPFKSKFLLSKGKTGFDFEWKNFKFAPDYLGSDTDKKTYAPKIRVELAEGGARRSLVKLQPRYSYDYMHESIDETEPKLSGMIRAIWSPQARRVVVSISEQMTGGHEEMSYLERSSSYIRAGGAQIKLIEAGIGYQIARKAGAIFDEAGLFVTTLEKADKPAEGVVLYFRGEAGKAAAQAVKGLIPSASSEELKKGGWVDLIVVLGR